jgi:hypothetical protein
MTSSKFSALRHPIQWGKKVWGERFGDSDDRPPRGVLRRKGVKKPPVDKRITPDFEAIGCRGGYFFLTDSSNYLKRHVETLQIQSASFGRRRLTIDVQLPSDGDLGKRGVEGEYEFWIPVTFLAKRPPRSNIDLRDDRDRVVPLLTRRENNEITHAAVMTAARELLPADPSQLLQSLLCELVTCDGIASEVALVLAKEALRSEGATLSSEKALAFVESLRVLSGNYAAWVAFQGRPGERRVIKFHYDVEFDRQRVLRQRRAVKNYVVYARRSEEIHALDVEEIGDKNPYSPLRRLAARIASATGLGAVNVGIESPYIVGSDSYHLQVESPPGVETRDIDLFATVDEEGDADSWKRDHGAHLYVNRARLAEEGAGIALLTLRIGRRGFMTLAWLSAVLSAAILWLFDLTAEKHIESPEATAAVLLFGPALLAALVVRPGEHPVATKLFSGVRLLVALSGVLVVGAAAAVAGVTPEGWSVEHLWFVSAIAATVSAAMVTLGWVFSWDITYKLVKGLRRQLSTGEQYRRLCAWLLGSTALALFAGWVNQWILLPPELYLVPAIGLLFACGFVAAGYAGLQRSSALPAAVAIDLNCLALLAAVTTLALDLRSGFGWETWWLRLAVVPLGGLLILLFNDRRWKRRHAGQPRREIGDVEGIARRWLREADPRPNWLRPTPSAARIREEARKNATGIPDLIAPSAYREVEPTEGLIDEAGAMYVKFVQARANKGIDAVREKGEEEESVTEESFVLAQLENGGAEVVVLDL